MTKASAILTALLFVVCPEPSRADINAEIQIDCSSGAVDTDSNKLDSLTDAICQQTCVTEKCNEVSTLAAADTCLSKESLLGCLFDVNQMRSTNPEWCSTTHKEDNQDALAVVAKIAGTDLSSFGNGSVVKDVFLRLGIQNTNITCNSKGVDIGHSLETFDKDKCVYSGGSEIEATVSLANNTMVVPVTSMFKGLYEANHDVVIFAELKDPACNITVEDAKVIFSVEYRSGYSPSVACMAVETCLGCLQNGCHWCDWSSSVNFFLPEWLPDWDLINAAREKNHGVCGLNSAVCTLSLGRRDICGALSAISAVSAITAIAVAAGMSVGRE